ncbi:MAG: bis(5'-nucleosyl)-tetraphosphatase (symmetrical) YqeK [Oscillospiraceae bacterium]|nr:bis(5'-nucleosyl)-tetraphosphatase (symmetrical) YqeK [Oscillospiraceae bacterium]
MTRTEILGLLSEWLSDARLAHSLETEKMAARLAILHNEDPEKAATAALLHDLCRCLPTERQHEYIKRDGITLSKEWMLSPQLWHGPAAAFYIQAELEIYDRDILDAVRCHTTARAQMSTLEKIIYLADKAEDSRDYNGVEEIRAAAQRSLDEGVYLTICKNLTKQCRKGRPLVKEALGAYNELAVKFTVDSKKEG